MLKFNKKNRELTSDTGYVKSINDGDTPEIYDHPIYLGINVTVKDFAEATKEEYEAYLKAKEEDKLHVEDKPS